METESQLGADKWVLSKFPKDYQGYFLDVGAADGFTISNTLLLERNGWKGIAVDAFPRNFDKRTNTIVESAVVAGKKGEMVDFLIPTHYRDFSGITKNLGKHRDILSKVESQTVCRETSLLSDILEKHNSPSTIDYMNLDVEGSEYEILSTFPFEKYTITYITVEHNFEEPKRTLIYNLLKSKGYEREREVEWDDWYVKF